MAETTKATPQTASMTKVEAVRRALQALGKDALPSKLQPYIKQTFGIDMTPAHITTCKGGILRKGKKKPGPKPKVQPEPLVRQSAPTPPARPAAKNGITLEDIQSVKGLIGRVEPDQLKGLIDLLSK
jgi:hypothetical protein